jgi:hypothetical protein
MHDQQGAGNGSLLMTSASALGHFCRQKNADLHRRQHDSLRGLKLLENPPAPTARLLRTAKVGFRLP